MLTVDRQQRRAVLAYQRRHQCTGGDERFLVGEADAQALPDRGDGGGQAGRADDRSHDIGRFDGFNELSRRVLTDKDGRVGQCGAHRVGRRFVCDGDLSHTEALCLLDELFGSIARRQADDLKLKRRVVAALRFVAQMCEDFERVHADAAGRTQHDDAAGCRRRIGHDTTDNGAGGDARVAKNVVRRLCLSNLGGRGTRRATIKSVRSSRHVARREPRLPGCAFSGAFKATAGQSPASLLEPTSLLL